MVCPYTFNCLILSVWLVSSCIYAINESDIVSMVLRNDPDRINLNTITVVPDDS